MAKSTRSKVKRHFRAKKRTEGVYAVAEAARLNRLHQKLKTLSTKDRDGDVEVEDVSNFGDEEGDTQQSDRPQTESGEDAMELDPGAGPSTGESTKRISTHGPRNSRNEQWRLAKGLPLNKSKGTNKQGVPVAKRKAGRSHRRR
ncbi:hypothetical protein QCA50_000286 [Cerrena zonata]|uniref:DUF2423 domain-containing protein n=1 Tax=Cerrena zonata TaxID=2478898 RepID=A0AAW0GZJ4_9APHY